MLVEGALENAQNDKAAEKMDLQESGAGILVRKNGGGHRWKNSLHFLASC